MLGFYPISGAPISGQPPAATGTLYFQSASCGGTGTATLVKQPRLSRSFTATGTPSFSRIASFLRTLSNTATGTVSYTKRVSLAAKNFTATGTASLLAALLFNITRSFSATGTVSLARRIEKVLSNTATGAVSLGRAIAKSFAFTATGTPSYSDVLQYNIVFGPTGTGTASLSTQYTPGAGGPFLNPWYEGKTIYPLASKAGLREWVDYIPVKLQTGGRDNSFDNDGNWKTVQVLSSGQAATKTAWADYIPVYVEGGYSKPWSTDPSGFIPFDDVTP